MTRLFAAVWLGALLGCAPADAPQTPLSVSELIARARIDDRSRPCDKVDQVVFLGFMIDGRMKMCGWIVVQGKIHLYQQIEVKGRSVSVAVTINPAAPPKAAIHFVGGPGGTILMENLLDRPSFANALTKAYRYVYTPGYSGTQSSTSLEDGEIESAAFEGATLAKMIENKRLVNNVDVIGTSLGGHVSAKVMGQIANRGENLPMRHLLFVPLTCSSYHYVNYFDLKLVKGKDYKPLTLTVVVVDGETGAEIDVRDVDSIFLIRKFIGSANEHNDLAHYLDKLPVKPKIVMGSLDKRIYCGDEAYLKAFMAKYPTTIIPGMNHVPTTWDQLSQVMKAIE